MIKSAITLALGLALPPAAQASPLGLTPRDTYALMQAQGDGVLFIDVRDPVEIMFTGFTDVVDTNIPFVLVNRRVWDQQNNRFRLEPNPDFARQVEQALRAKGLNRNAMVITMCRSGSERGEPSAVLLQELGFSNARFVVNGFQGDRRNDGPRAGMRVTDGWENSGLPWSPRLKVLTPRSGSHSVRRCPPPGGRARADEATLIRAREMALPWPPDHG